MKRNLVLMFAIALGAIVLLPTTVAFARGGRTGLPPRDIQACQAVGRSAYWNCRNNNPGLGGFDLCSEVERNTVAACESGN